MGSNTAAKNLLEFTFRLPERETSGRFVSPTMGSASIRATRTTFSVSSSVSILLRNTRVQALALLFARRLFKSMEAAFGWSPAQAAGPFSVSRLRRSRPSKHGQKRARRDNNLLLCLPKPYPDDPPYPARFLQSKQIDIQIVHHRGMYWRRKSVALVHVFGFGN